MNKTKLQYLGKKRPCVIDTSKLSKPVTFHSDIPMWVNTSDAKWLIETNPSMFRKLGERSDEEVDVEVDEGIEKEVEGPEPEPSEDKPKAKYPSQMNVDELIQEGFKHGLDFTIDTPEKKKMRELIAAAKAKS